MVRAFYRIGRAVCAALCLSAFAGLCAPVPSEAEQAEVRPVVERLTADDFAQLRAKRVSHGEMSSLLLSYATAAESSAARFLLVRTAFRQKAISCVQGEEGNGGVSSLEEMFDTVLSADGVLYAVEVARFSLSDLRRLADRRVDGAKAFMQRFAELERKTRPVGHFRDRVAKSPDDPALRDGLGRSYAALGEWDAALAEFANAGGGRHDSAARFELAYPLVGAVGLTSADVAEHWWAFADDASVPADARGIYRDHAAQWYRVAITNGVLRGLKRAVAERRIAAAEADSAAAASSTTSSSATDGAQPGADGLPPIRIPLLRDMELNLVGIPVGAETNSRPFWISPTAVSREQFRVYRRSSSDDSAKSGADAKKPVSVSSREASAFCEHLTKKFRSRLPNGYVFRLPVAEERERALAAFAAQTAAGDSGEAAAADMAHDIAEHLLDPAEAARAAGGSSRRAASSQEKEAEARGGAKGQEARFRVVVGPDVVRELGSGRGRR